MSPRFSATRLAWLALLLMAVVPSEAARPNVLFIPVDDLSDHVSVLQDHPGVRTPNLDRLARRSVNFTRAFTAAPVCQPSRSAVVSGLAPDKTGVYYLTDPMSTSPALRHATPLEEQFRRHGYATFMTGKYYHGLPVSWWPPELIEAMWTERRPPFSDHGPYLEQGHLIEDSTVYRIGAAPGGSSSMPDTQSLEHTREWLSRRHDKPFFLVQGINKPHLAFVVPQEFYDLHPLESIVLPDVPEDDWSDIPAVAAAHFGAVDLEQFRRIRGNQEDWKRVVQSYLASMSYFDWVLGQILDALDASLYADDTIIVLWSDHGYHLGEKEKLHKMALWTQTCRVPLLISLPGMPTAGRPCAAPVSLLDIFPTLDALCDFEQPVSQRLDGHSLVPLLEDVEATWEHVAVTSHLPGNAAVSDSRYRYIRYADGSEELYDHRVDPREVTNVIALAEYRPIADRLAGHLPTDWAPMSRTLEPQPRP